MKASYTSLQYVVMDINTGIPAGCACGGTWANGIQRTVTPGQCGSGCSMLTDDYHLGLFNASGIWMGPSEKTGPAAWAHTALDSTHFGAVVATGASCTNLVAGYPTSAAVVGHAASALTVALAVIASVLAIRNN